MRSGSGLVEPLCHALWRSWCKIVQLSCCRWLLLCLSGVVLCGCAGNTARPLSVERAHHDFGLAVAAVQQNFVDEVRTEVLVDDAVAAMYLFAGVEPSPDVEAAPDDPLARFSQVYEQLRDHAARPLVKPEAQPQHGEQAATDQVDIGLLLTKSGEWIRIAAVMAGSAAEAAGMNRGDAIIAINGQATAGMPVSWCYQQLSGAEGTVVEVSVNSEEGEVVDYRVVRSRVRTPHVVMLLPRFMG